MDPILLDLTAMADHLLVTAAASSHHRASQRIDLGFQQLRMMAIGFAEGAELPEHHTPGDAVLQVVCGRIRLTDETRTIEIETGTIVRIPDVPYRVEALEPSVILLTALPVPGRHENHEAGSRH